MRDFLHAIWPVCLFIVIVSAVGSQICVGLPTPPHMFSCNHRAMIVLDSTEGTKWPAGSVSGCRCLLEYNDKVYIDFENRDPKFCDPEQVKDE